MNMTRKCLIEQAASDVVQYLNEKYNINIETHDVYLLLDNNFGFVIEALESVIQ